MQANNLLSNQHVRRRRSRAAGKDKSIFSQRLGRRTGAGSDFHFSRIRGNTASKREGRFSLSLPLLPLAGLCMLVFGLVLTLNNRESLSFAWAQADVVPVETAGTRQVEYNMARYAGVLPPEEQASRDNSSGGTAVNLNAGAVPGLNSPETTEGTGEIPLNLAETFAWESYKVKKGDSVSKIAAAYSVSMDAVIASNDISNVRLLREGEILRIPNMDGIPYKVKKGDSLSKISGRMGVPLEAILDANDIQRDIIKEGETIFIPGARMKSEDLKLALGELFLYPLKGATLSSGFGWRNDPISGVRRYHSAIDLAASTGTPVRAASDGTVSVAGFNLNYGKYIILTHGGGYKTLYAHLNDYSVKQGDRVIQGGKIGEVGSTGYSTGPHLHFAVFKNGRAVNPLDFLHL
jgi:murein DD-endopeptidase MepM/ murein hydrolase activator NlpD